MVRRATDDDYKRLQGGRPSVTRDGQLWFIDHSSYKKGGKRVRTHISPEQRGTVIINGVEYNTAELWQFEGHPCEVRSLKVGGNGYETGSGRENKG